MREYFERFPVVEVQQTFYEPPPERRFSAAGQRAAKIRLHAEGVALITHARCNA